MILQSPSQSIDLELDWEKAGKYAQLYYPA